MPTGRTPTMTISGVGGTVTLEDIRTALPFPAISVRREYQDRYTRHSIEGPAKKKRIFRKYNKSEESMRVQVPYLSLEDYAKLRGFIEADPPEVTISYLHVSVEKFDIVELEPLPDEWDWVNDKSFRTSFSLLRQSV